MGARISVSVDEDASVVMLSGPADEMPRMLDLLADLVRNPVFPEEAVSVKRAEQAARRRSEHASARQRPAVLLQSLLQGFPVTVATPHPAQPSASADRDDLLSFFRASFRPDNATLVVAGATTLDALTPQVELAFGGWQGAAAPLPAAARPSTPDGPRMVYLIDIPGSTQSVIAAGHLTLAPDDPDFDLMPIVATILRFRLTANLREAKQWSYAPYADLGSGAGGRRIFAAVATVQQDKTAEAMLEILHELSGLAGARPATPEEIERAKTSELRLLAVYSQTNALTAQRVDEASRIATGEIHAFDMIARRLAAIGSDEVSRVVARLIQPERLAWLVIGDQRQIAESVGTLGLGELREIATDGVGGGMAFSIGR